MWSLNPERDLNRSVLYDSETSYSGELCPVFGFLYYQEVDFVWKRNNLNVNYFAEKELETNTDYSQRLFILHVNEQIRHIAR